MEYEEYEQWRSNEISQQEGKWKSRHPESAWTAEQWKKEEAEFGDWYEAKYQKNYFPGKRMRWEEVREFFRDRFSDAAVVDEYFGYSKREEVPF